MIASLFHWTAGAGLLFVAVTSIEANPPLPKPPAENIPDAVRAAAAQAIQKVYPALVRIHVVYGDFVEGREVKGEGSGSGVILTKDGHVITNHHVVMRAKRIRCILSDKHELRATLVGTDPLADIAVLQLQRDGQHKNKEFPFAEFGKSDALKVGDRVLAMGCPRALSQSVTLGIVSNLAMTLPKSQPMGFTLDGEDVGTVVKWIGHDAQIFPGNSGGPLVTLQGKIVGINDIGIGLGGAIPGDLAQEVAAELIKHGEVKRSWLGVSVQPLLKSCKSEQGVLVSSVSPDSPADKAGLKAGDLLLSYQGKPVTVRFAEQLSLFHRTVLSTPIGARVEIVYERDGQKLKGTTVTVSRGAAQGKETELREWGLTVRELTLLEAQRLKREPYSGLLITGVRQASPAAEAKFPLQFEDVLTTVAGTEVKTLKQLLDKTAALTSGKKGPTPVLAGFERGSQKLLSVVKIGSRQTADLSVEPIKAWLPVTTQVLTPDLAEALGLKGKKGVRITSVFADSTAAKAKLQVGDVLVKFDGEPIDASEQPEDEDVFPAMVRQNTVGAKVKLDIFREGKPLMIEVELAPSSPSPRQVVEYQDKHFEFRARDLTVKDRVKTQLGPTQQGVLITHVEIGGWAYLARLNKDDVVLAVDGQTVPTIASLKARMETVAKNRPERVVFFVRHGVQTRFVELEPDWPAK
jgi:serine protease Do